MSARAASSPGAATPSPAPPSWSAFRLLAGGETVSQFGTQLAALAIPTYAIQVLGASAVETSAINAAQWAPPLVFGLMIGRLADRFSRQRLILLSDGLGFVLTALAAVLMVMQAFTLPWILAYVACAATCGTVYGVASQALLPSLLHHRQLMRGNAYLNAVRALSQILGNLAAARFVALGSGGWVMGVNALTFLVRGLLVNQAKPAEASAKLAPAQPAGGALRLLWALRARPYGQELLRLIGAQATYNCGGAFILGYFFVYAYGELALTPQHVGLMLAVGSGFALLASLAMPRFLSQAPLNHIALGAILVSSASVWLLVLARWASPFSILLLYQALFSASGAIFMAAVTTRRQLVTPPEEQGRIASCIVFATYFALVNGSLLALATASFVTPFIGVVLGCALSSLTSLWFLTPATKPAGPGKPRHASATGLVSSEPKTDDD